MSQVWGKSEKDFIAWLWGAAGPQCDAATDDGRFEEFLQEFLVKFGAGLNQLQKEREQRKFLGTFGDAMERQRAQPVPGENVRWAEHAIADILVSQRGLDNTARARNRAALARKGLDALIEHLMAMPDYVYGPTHLPPKRGPEGKP